MKRLTYISSFTRPLMASEVEEIGERSVKNNTRDGLTGVLFSVGNAGRSEPLTIYGPPGTLQVAQAAWRALAPGKRTRAR